jgi:quercetin dioxygenase-like cupin family protein
MEIPMRVASSLTFAALTAAAVFVIHARSYGHAASGTVVKDLCTEPVAEFPGHELAMVTVEYPPGAGSSPHRHDSYVLVYVLEGAVQMKVQGGALRTVMAGESFVERPGDVHEISRNASARLPAKFLVVALKSSGQPLSKPVAGP